MKRRISRFGLRVLFMGASLAVIVLFTLYAPAVFLAGGMTFVLLYPLRALREVEYEE